MVVTVTPLLQKAFPQGRYAWAIFSHCQVSDSPHSLKEDFEGIQKIITGKFSVDTIKNAEGVAFSRQAFKEVGCDPARYRPAQEALMRRTVLGKPITFINAAVDINNFLSLKYQLPMGIYNTEAIEGDCCITIGRNDEEYMALNGRSICREKKIICCDKKGPIGGPYVDSMRTRIEKGERNLLHIIYFLPYDITSATLKEIAEIIHHYLGWRTQGYKVIP